MPMISQVDASLNVTHISTDLRNYEAARSPFFVLFVDGLNNLLRPDYSGDPAAATDGDRINEDTAEQTLKLNIVKSSVPQFTLSTDKYRRGNDVVNFATTPEWKDGDMTVDDVVGVNTKDILISWLYLAYNPHTRMGGRMADYKKTATLCEYTQDYELIRQWRIEGIFVTEVNEDEFDRENDNKRKLSAKLKYDRAVQVPLS